MLKRVSLFFALMVATCSTMVAQPDKGHWVDSVFNSMSTDEKIGQLFMLVVPSHASKDVIDKLKDDVKDNDIGGVVFERETPRHQAVVTKNLQSTSKIPLLVGQDAEWGIGQLIDSAISFPRPMVLGAIANDSMIYLMGREIARQMKVMGLNLNFAPLADISGKPEDPLISYRSFGENKNNVTKKATAFMLGMQNNGVLACAKQYNIKGLTVTGYDGEIPVVQATVDTARILPFTGLFENNVAGVMAASSNVPLFYENVKFNKKDGLDANTMSALFTGRWITQKQNFKGLTFVDLQFVKVVTDKSKDGDEAGFAFQAGNDVMIERNDVSPAIKKIKRLIKSDDQYQLQLDQSVKKILAAKYNAGLYKKPEIVLDNLVAKLNAPAAMVLKEQLYQQAVTVIHNQKNIIPVLNLESKRFAYVGSDVTDPNTLFFKYLTKYAQVQYFNLDDKTDLVQLAEGLGNFDVTFIGIFPQTQPNVMSRVERLSNMLKPAAQLVFCDFGNETFLKTASKYHSVVTAYVNTAETLRAVPEVIFGGLSATGALPFSPSKELREGTGVNTTSLKRLVYSLPEASRMNSKAMARIDSIAREAIKIGATPGMQIIVARDGKIVYEKNFGTLNYNKNNPVTSETIYDLASLTKVSATLQTAMFMYEKGLIDIHKKVSYYLPELKNSNKKDITLLEMLTHQAGLAPFIPMWPQTMKDSTFLPLYYSRTKSAQYPLQVSSNLYAAPVIRDSVWSWIVKSKLIDKQPRTPFVYRYSDLGFLILQRVAEKLLNQPLDDFVSQHFYEPLGAYSTGFLPLTRFPVQRIAPTEYDKIFRKTMVDGTVHDERGALMGGVAGHAGLFSSANDLAKLGQMLLQEGTYGGYRYYKPETVRMFSNKQFDKSRRGLGWDKPIQSDWSSPTSLLASPRTFGHTGFTGTCLWIDPEFNLVYVFLSNRVYPDRSNKLNSENIRSRIQDVIYDAIFTYCDEFPIEKPATQNNFVSTRR
ncbi:MAG: serine hydrolase [Chryseolinea sp.]